MHAQQQQHGGQPPWHQPLTADSLARAQAHHDRDKVKKQKY
jgi:hypothetical protein